MAVGALALASGCGVTADTTAATVAGETISVDAVDRLANDEAFIGAEPDDMAESRLDGGLARSVLMFEIERVATIAEAERWGLETTDAVRDQAEQQLDQQIEQSGVAFSGSTRDALLEYLAAQLLLGQRFTELDPADNGDLEMLYDGSPALWDRVCLFVVRVGPDQVEEAEEALDGGATLEDLQERIVDSQVLADPAQACIAQNQLPTELRDGVEGATVGGRNDAILIGDGAGGENAFLFRLDGRESLSFAEAQPELVTIAESLREQGAQSWVQLQITEAEINPRYGAGVAAQGQGTLAITPPPAPALPRTGLITDAVEQIDPSQVDPAQSGS